LRATEILSHCLDISTDPPAEELLDLTGPGTRQLPVLLFSDGSILENPTLQAIAEKTGLHRPLDVPVHHLIIVGGGPAGLAAAVYGASEGLRTAVVERHAAGGQ